MMEPGGVTAAPYMGTQGLEQSPPIDREPPVLAPHPKHKTRDSPPFFLFPFPFPSPVESFARKSKRSIRLPHS